MRPAVALVCALRFASIGLVLGLPARAAAQSAPLELTWQGPRGCDRAGYVRERVARLLGSGARKSDSPLRARVAVHEDAAGRFSADLETETAYGVGRKRLEGESCDAIALAVAVVLALAVAPDAELELEAEPEPDPDFALATEPARPLSDREALREPLRPRQPRPPRASAYLQASGGVLFSLLSEPSTYIAFGVGTRYRRFSLEITGAAHRTHSLYLSERAGAGAELELFSARLLGCFTVLPYELTPFDACAGPQLENLTATAFGVTDPDSGSVLLVSGVLALRARLRATSWLSAALDVGVAARAFHPTFVLQGVGDVFEVPTLSPFIATGLNAEF
jgi:hypothetical protein